MKNVKNLSAIVIASSALLLSAQANADTLLGGYVGAQAWNMDATGGFSENENIAGFAFESEQNASFYAALEHPIPLVPNIKLARTTMDTQGSTTLDTQFNFGDEVFLANATLDTQIEMTATDYILYYELLDSDIATLDIGVAAKQLEGDIVVVDQDGNMAEEEFDGMIPMAYAKVAFGLPLTGLGVFAEGTFLSIDDDSFTDYQAGISYNFVETLAIDMTIQLGYRSTELDIEDLDDIYANLEFDGAFLGIEFDF